MENKQLTRVEHDDNVVDFADAKLRLKTAIGDPNDPIWLNNLGVGSIFLARKKGVAEFALGMFCIEGKSEKAVFLLEQSMGDKSIAIDPIRFCSQFEMYELLRDSETFLAELELNKNVKRDTSDESPVENDAGSEENNQPV